MLNVKVDFHTSRAPTEAFGYIARGFFENHPKWDPAIVGLTKTSDGPIAAGTTGTEVRKFGGKQRADFRITTFEPDGRFAFTNTSGPFALDRAYTIERNGAGTKVTFTFDMAPRNALGRVIFPLARGSIAKQVHANIARLEELLG